MTSKEEAIRKLRVAVSNDNHIKGQKVANDLREVINMNIGGWEPAESGIIWHGFYIYRAYDLMFDSALATYVTSYRTDKALFRKPVEVAECTRKIINSPRDMLDILENNTPWNPDEH